MAGVKGPPTDARGRGDHCRDGVTDKVPRFVRKPPNLGPRGPERGTTLGEVEALGPDSPAPAKDGTSVDPKRGVELGHRAGEQGGGEALGVSAPTGSSVDDRPRLAEEGGGRATFNVDTAVYGQRQNSLICVRSHHSKPTT